MSETETLSPLLPNDVEQPTRRLLEKACERDLHFATAEGCAGRVSVSLLTDAQGSAHAFGWGFVTYGNEANFEMLGVPMELIESEGVLATAKAIAMAPGGLDMLTDMP